MVPNEKHSKTGPWKCFCLWYVTTFNLRNIQIPTEHNKLYSTYHCFLTWLETMANDWNEAFTRQNVHDAKYICHILPNKSAQWWVCDNLMCNQTNFALIGLNRLLNKDSTYWLCGRAVTILLGNNFMKHIYNNYHFPTGSFLWPKQNITLYVLYPATICTSVVDLLVVPNHQTSLVANNICLCIQIHEDVNANSKAGSFQ